MTTLFQGKDIALSYPRSRFKLEVETLNLQPGSITGVVGENGNGKTTLLKIIAGELRAGGEYHYFGDPVTVKSNWLDLKSNIAFIPQRIPRWYGTLEQNLYLKAALEDVPYVRIDEELDTLLDFLDLQKFRKLKWSEISTGYRLRFELARVLLGRPSLLVLDEPLANLDINTQQKFLSDLKHLLNKRDQELAVILSSQQLHEIESVANHMLFLKQGKSTFGGSLDDIQATSTFGLYEVQVDAAHEQQVFDLFGVNEVKHIGPYLQIHSEMKGDEVLTQLIKQGVVVRYYRDLSRSTKRFFNN